MIAQGRASADRQSGELDRLAPAFAQAKAKAHPVLTIDRTRQRQRVSELHRVLAHFLAGQRSPPMTSGAA